MTNSNELAFVRDLQAHLDEADERHMEMLGPSTPTSSPGRSSCGGSQQGVLAGPAPHDAHPRVGPSGRAHCPRRVRSSRLAGGGLQHARWMRRLYDLWRDDFCAVSLARAGDQPVPEDFGELRPYIGQAVDRIQSGSSPIAVINGRQGRRLRAARPRLPAWRCLEDPRRRHQAKPRLYRRGVDNHLLHATDAGCRHVNADGPLVRLPRGLQGPRPPLRRPERARPP